MDSEVDNEFNLYQERLMKDYLYPNFALDDNDDDSNDYSWDQCLQERDFVYDDDDYDNDDNNDNDDDDDDDDDDSLLIQWWYNDGDTMPRCHNGCCNNGDYEEEEDFDDGMVIVTMRTRMIIMGRILMMEWS